MELKEATVLITGGTSGIGLAFAEAFLKAGSLVLICGLPTPSGGEPRSKELLLLVKIC